MMHEVVTTQSTTGPFVPLSKLQLPHPAHQLPKPQQKLDWATECQTPLVANDDRDHDKDGPNKDSSSPSPGSEDSPDHPSTPPARRPSVAPQKPSFSPSPLLLTSNGASEPLSRTLGWRFSTDGSLAEELMKMQIRDVAAAGNQKPDPEDGQPHSSPLETSSDANSVRDGPFAMHAHIPLQPAAHSRGSSGDTSSSDSSSAQLQINTAVGAAVGNKPYTAAPGNRPRSFQEGLNITDAERKRLQILSPVKLQGIETGQGPKTSVEPPREPREQQAQRFQSPEVAPTPGGAHQPRYPSLQDQPQQQQQPTYPSIQQQQAQHHHQHSQQQSHRPPPINIGSEFRLNRPEDEYIQARLPSSAQFTPQGRVVSDGVGYRQPVPGPGPRGAQFAHAMQMGGPASILAPPGAGYGYAHPHPSPHLPLGPPTPQMYDLSLPASPFRGAHQHSASDPASIRDQTAALALMQAHMPPMHPFNVNVGGSPLPHAAMLYPSQFYGGAGVPLPVQEAYPGIPRMQQNGQYQQQNGAPTPSAGSYGGGTPVSGGSQNGGGSQLASGGPSANNRKLGLYKTELCRSWEEKGSCRYGPKCQFAHGEDEIRKVARHPKYKTEICRTFWVSGSCPYGKRCCFIHTELPASGAPPASAAGGAPPAETPVSNGSSTTTAGRGRSMSTNSDPNDAPVSLLTRIANQRTADAQAAANERANAVAAVSTPTEGSSTPTYQFPQQRPGSLRVDTSTLDTQISMKQNKSAYPYTNNHSLPKSNDHTQLISPGPVTAGPDLGRSSARFDVVGYNERYGKQQQQQAQTPTTGQQTPTNAQSSGNPLRHSFNGTENLNPPSQLALSSGHTSPFGASQTSETANASTNTNANAGANGSNNANGGPGNKTSPAPAHSRSESASGGNWGAPFTRGLGVPANTNANSPWSGDLSVGSNRLNTERKWS